MENKLSWDEFFLGLAKETSKKSKDPSTKVGVVIADKNHRLVSLGYNGFPQGILDSPERLNNRELKYKYVVHGDVNAILNAERSVRGCTMYTYPFPPCSDCAKVIIQAGIKRVVAPKPSPEIVARWADSLNLTRELFKEAGVELDERD